MEKTGEVLGMPTDFRFDMGIFVHAATLFLKEGF